MVDLVYAESAYSHPVSWHSLWTTVVKNANLQPVAPSEHITLKSRGDSIHRRTLVPARSPGNCALVRLCGAKPTMSESPSTHELAEEHGAELPLYHSLWAMITEGVKKNADGPAVISMYQGANHLSFLISKDVEDASHLIWTYTELQEAAERLAEILHATGVRKGSVVALFLYNSVEWCLFFWACAKMEACFAPLNPDSIHRPNELKHLLQTLEPNVLVVQDSNLATSIEKETWEIVSEMKLKIICESSKGSNSEHWKALSTLEAFLPHSCDDLLNAGIVSNESAVVFFTSGTTSLPKACPRTVAILDSSSQSASKRLEKEFRYLSNARCFHVAALVHVALWRAGATPIIPARGFDAGATLQALKSQRCTHMDLTPSMMYAIQNHPLLETYPPPSLTYLGLVADIVPQDLLTKCEEIFKPKYIRSPWGMTEGIGLTSYGSEGSVPSQDGVITAGKVSPGSRVRICKPETRIPLKRGEKGEIHCGGTSVIQGYLKDISHEAFYNDEKGNWFVSGDQGTMDDDGNIYVHGRYKDIIIRGGENISPATIESCLNAQASVMVISTSQAPSVSSLTTAQSQVVGVPDPVMGEAPVAIIKSLSDKIQSSDLKSVLHQIVLRELGTSYAVAEVFTLGELGLNDFPLTASGKIIKHELRSYVVEHLSQLDRQRRVAQSASTLGQIKGIWGRLLGVSLESLDQSISVTEVADSLTIMRFSYEVEKQLGKRLSLPEIFNNATLEQHAQLLDSKEKTRQYDTMPWETRISSGAPSSQDMVFTSGDPLEATRIANLVKPTLDALHLTWDEDVEDVYQNTDTMRVHYSTRRRPISSNLRWAYKYKNMDITQFRQALEKTLSRHTTFRSLLVETDDGAPIHVIIRPSKQFYDQCIKEGTEVTTVDRVRHLLGSMDMGFAGPTGPLFRALIVRMEDPGEFGLLLTIHHSTFDAFSLAMFSEDFRLALNQGTPTLQSRVPFKFFADAYYLHQNGTAAARDVRYQVDRLKGIWKMSKALWPVANGPEWFTGSDSGWTDASGRPGRPGERLAFDKEEQRPEGLAIIRKEIFPSLQKFKLDRAVDVSVLAKAAVALFNTEMTGQDHALFCNLDAGRTWPFLEPWIADRLPNPMSIAGPTLTSTINSFALDPLETVGAFLRRVQVDQVEQSARAHAPFLAVKQQLGERDGRIVDDICRRQVFNWDPSMRTRSATSDSQELLDQRGWVDYGFFWNFGLKENDELVGFVLYDDAHLRNHEAKAALDRVFAIIRWMAVPENWSKTIGEVGKSWGGDELHVVKET